MSKTKLVVGVVVVAVIAVGAYVYLVPFQHRLNVAKQQRTSADIRNVGTAMFSWLTDQIGTGPQDPRMATQLAGLDERPSDSIFPDEEGVMLVVLMQDAPPAQAAEEESGQWMDLKDYQQISFEELKKRLVPMYIQEIPELDGWGHPYEFYLKVDDVLSPQVLAIRSAGRDGKFEASRYKVQAFPADSFDRDIVWTDGFFVQWPEKPVQ